MNKEALNQLYRVVTDAPDDQFDMTVFWCGSARCAIGHAYSDPWFVKNTAIEKAFNPPFGKEQLTLRPDTYQRLGDIFGITQAMAGRLFGAVNPISASKRQVLQNICRTYDGRGPLRYRDMLSDRAHKALTKIKRHGCADTLDGAEWWLKHTPDCRISEITKVIEHDYYTKAELLEEIERVRVQYPMNPFLNEVLVNF